MTMWFPQLQNEPGPRYLAIADAIADDVKDGKLAPGARLPTHRELASQLGVTVGTVSRAYAETERRGVTTGEVGRGTFVRDLSRKRPEFVVVSADSELINLSVNHPASEIHAEEVSKALTALAANPNLAELLSYQPEAGLYRHREAGAQWLRRAGLDADPDQIIVTCGGQHALSVILSALTSPGDFIAAEALTYPGIKALADRLNLNVAGIAMDEHGILPEEFSAACENNGTRLRALMCIPSPQNPTNARMPMERRRQIMEIAKTHGVIIVEDDVYGFLDRNPSPLTSFAPEQSCYLTSISKSMVPALRVGYVYAPKAILMRVKPQMRASVWMASPLLAEVATQWISDGTANRLADWQREELFARQKIAAAILEEWHGWNGLPSFHIWLRLPEPWQADNFTAQARAHGVAVMPASVFAAGRTIPPQAVRVCLGATKNRAELTQGLEILADILRAPVTPGFAGM